MAVLGSYTKNLAGLLLWCFESFISGVSCQVNHKVIL